MKILTLTIKRKWFDMIASGDKKAEYRELKVHWIQRLTETTFPEEEKGENKVIPYNIEFDIHENGYEPNEILKCYWSTLKNFDAVLFRNGYRPDSPTLLIECKGIDIGPAVPEWSDNWNGDVFRIKLGEIIKKP